MQITVNGKEHRVSDGTSLGALLEQMNVNRQQVAVEVNTELIPRERHAECSLRTGDRLEIVTLVGGG